MDTGPCFLLLSLKKEMHSVGVNWNKVLLNDITSDDIRTRPFLKKKKNGNCLISPAPPVTNSNRWGSYYSQLLFLLKYNEDTELETWPGCTLLLPRVFVRVQQFGFQLYFVASLCRIFRMLMSTCFGLGSILMKYPLHVQSHFFFRCNCILDHQNLIWVSVNNAMELS